MNREEIQVQIKELQDKLNILSSELEKCKNESILRIRKPELGKKYYLIFGNCVVDSCLNQNDNVDNIYFENGNYWFTKKEAEFEAQREKYTRLYRKYVEEHSEPMDCTDAKLERFYAYWDIVNQTIEIANHKGYIDGFQIYGYSEEVISNAIKFISEDNFKKYILGIKE